MRGLSRPFAVFAIVATSVVAPAEPAAAANPIDAPIVDRGVVLDVVPWVRIPDNTEGRPRLNALATAGDRIFVVEDRDGRIHEIVVDDEGVASASLFFDVGAAIAAATPRMLDRTNLSHGGLRGLAFHPDFAENGRFYTSLMETRPAVPDPADYLSDAVSPIGADSVLVEWTYDHGSAQVSPSTYRQVFRVGMPVYDHPIKQIAFNPFAEPGDPDRGMLYIGHGDGSVLSATAGGGLNDDALGKVLRIDPLRDGAASYRVPADNPFVGDPGMLDEVWSIGHRNPHHLAFARHDDAVHLIVAEPGRDNVEEVNLIEPRANYGWSEREGTFVHLPSGDLIDGIAPLPANDAVNGYTYPAAQVGHEGEPGSGFSGQAIAGGFVVDNGSELSGRYFYANFPRTGEVYESLLSELTSAVTTLDAGDPARDHPDELTQAPTGRVTFRLDHDADPVTPPLTKTDLTDIVDDDPLYDGSGRVDTRFGQGPDGELYLMSKRNGWVYLVTNSVAPPPTCDGRAATVTGLQGTPADDVIVGTDGPDVIDGGGGDDLVCAGNGDDVVRGGDGADRILGGRGNDRLFGDAGADVLEGGIGRDVLRGGTGPDRLLGGTGNDRLSGNAGADDLRAENGRDRAFGNAGADTVRGGGGNDRLNGGSGTDTAIGGIGTDECTRFASVSSCER